MINPSGYEVLQRNDKLELLMEKKLFDILENVLIRFLAHSLKRGLKPLLCLLDKYKAAASRWLA